MIKAKKERLENGLLMEWWKPVGLFATYKVQKTGKWIEFVDAYNTSKRCSKCGKINEELKDEEAFICPFSDCDNVLDRDVNVAKNILWKAQVNLGLSTG